MERDQIQKLLEAVQSGEVAVEEAIRRLRVGPMDDLGFARLDLHRAVRRGFPEVVFGPGKTADQILTLVARLHEAGQTALVTRVGPEIHEQVAERFPRAEYSAAARILWLRAAPAPEPRAGVLVMCAGTADIPVAEEAAVTAEIAGSGVQRVYDVGIAGLHRLADQREALLAAKVAVVVAGMEGALPSVVAGLTDCPVIGVPTSSGYGVGERGLAALLAMLNSCAAGLTVVNVDNGFGAGYAAALILRRSDPGSGELGRADGNGPDD